MNARTTFPASGPSQLREARRQLRFRKLVALFERDEVEAAVDALIAHLDMSDGDIDLEPNGDEQDGNGSEDDFMRHGVDRGDGPGCPIADPDLAVDDANTNGATCPGDLSYAEWHTLPTSARRAGRIDGKPLDSWGGAVGEDEEDDDPGEEGDEAEDDGEDRCAGGDDHMIAGPVTQREGWERHEQLSGHLPGDDVDAEPEDHVTARAFRDSIRRARCTTVIGRDMYGREYVSRYELKVSSTTANLS